VPSQFSSDSILAEVRLRAKLPAADETWSDTNLLSVLNSELQSWAAPFLVQARAEFLETYEDEYLVAGQTTYSIPSKAIYGVVRALQALDSSGNPWPMQQLDLKEIPPVYTAVSGNPTAFYVMGDSIVLTVTPSDSSWRLRKFYARRPSKVVPEAQCAQITAIAGNQITCSGGFPATFTNGTAMDFIHGGSSFLPYSGTPTMPAPSGNNATFSSLPTGLAVGDWLCLRGESPFPQIPADMQPVLQQRLVAVVLRAEGDDKAAVEWRAFQEMEANARKQPQPRMPGNLKGLRGTLSRNYFPGRGGF
jgi:hypothetical protein